MKKFPAVCMAAGLLLGLPGCETDDSVQTGYLSPQQTATTGDAGAPASAPTDSTASAEDSHLPPPSVGRLSTPPESTPAPAPEPAKAESSTGTKLGAAERDEDEAPGTRTDWKFASAQKGGAIASASSMPAATRPEEQEREDSRAEVRKEEPREPVRTEAESDDDDQPRSRPPTAASSPAVTSNFSSSGTRVYKPGDQLQGVVVSVNQDAKFVVVKFDFGAVPPIGKVMGVVRNGEKVGMVKITKPVKPPHASADILEGTLRRGDGVQPQ